MNFRVVLASAAPWGYPRAPRGVPKVALKVRRPILHQFWGPFWHHLGSFLAPFGCHFGGRFLHDVLMAFWLQDGALLGPFWGHFWSQKIQKNQVDLRRRFRGRFWHSPGTLRGPKSLKTLGGLIKIEGRRFRAREAPGSILGAKTEPKFESETKKNRCKDQCKHRLRKSWNFVDFGARFGVVLGALFA